MAARNNRKFLSTSALTLGLIAFGAGSALAMDDFTTPTGEQVVGGSATFDRPAAGQLNINQNTDRVVINWDSFNIGSKGKTEFFQPNSGSLAVNRVTSAGSDPTQILGMLKANGKVMVLDRNGVFFGHDAVLDVGSIVASTGDIDTGAVMRGDTVLELSSFGDGSVINNGTISVGDAGLAAFVAPHVANNGIIQARLGKVALAAGGERATIDLYGDGLVQIAVDGAKTRALAENNGAIDAEGGTVLMTAAAAKGVVDNVINMNGVIKVSSVTQKGGKIILSGGSAGKVKVTGTIDASGANGGGDIDVRGHDIEVTETAVLNADATGHGNGGRSVVFADNIAIVNGRMSARGGLLGGNGGFIETSGLELGIGANATIGASAQNGQGGLWLIDPLSILISNAADSNYEFVNAVTLSNTLSGGTNVTLETGVNSASSFGKDNEGDIIIASYINHNGTANSVLTLVAHDDIILRDGVQIRTQNTGSLGLDFTARGVDGDIILENNSGINTNGGAVKFTANDDIVLAGSVTTGAGAVAFNAGDDIIIGGQGGNGTVGVPGTPDTPSTPGTPEYWTNGTITVTTNPATGWTEYPEYWEKTNGQNTQYRVDQPGKNDKDWVKVIGSIWKKDSNNGQGAPQYAFGNWTHHEPVDGTPFIPGTPPSLPPTVTPAATAALSPALAILR